MYVIRYSSEYFLFCKFFFCPPPSSRKPIKKNGTLWPDRCAIPYFPRNSIICLCVVNTVVTYNIKYLCIAGNANKVNN